MSPHDSTCNVLRILRQKPRRQIHGGHTCYLVLTKSFSQQGQAFGQRRIVVFVAFEFERDIASEIVLSHDPGDTGIIQIECVPQAAAVVGLGLYENRLRGALFKLIIRIFEEVTRIEQNLKPRRVDRIGDSQ